MKLTKKLRIPLYESNYRITFLHKPNTKMFENQLDYLVKELGYEKEDFFSMRAALMFSDKDSHGRMLTFFIHNYSNELVAHESLHLAWEVLHWCGVKVSFENHEALAYLIGHISGEVEKFHKQLKKKGLL